MQNVQVGSDVGQFESLRVIGIVTIWYCAYNFLLPCTETWRLHLPFSKFSKLL